MANRVGALLMPAPAPPFGPEQPSAQNSATLDPALSVLGAFFKAMLEHYCGDEWENIAPGEPLIRKLSIGHDPEEFDVSDNDLPFLGLWRENDGEPTRLDDVNAQQSTLVNVLWIAPPSDEQKLAARSPFFNAFTKTMLLAYQRERDPCWIREEDRQSDTARAYGSYVWGLAGLDGWKYSGTKRVPVQLPTGARAEMYAGYLATWTILESSETDPALWGSVSDGERIGVTPAEIYFDETDRAATEENPEVLVRQSALIPADPPES